MPLAAQLLLPDPKFLDDRAVALDVPFHQIIQKSSPFADEFEETAPRGMILGMALKVFGEFVDSNRKNCDLNFRRAGVGGRLSVFLYELFFLFGRDHVILFRLYHRKEERGVSQVKRFRVPVLSFRCRQRRSRTTPEI